MSILNPFVIEKESGANVSRLAFILEDQRMIFEAIYLMDGLPKSKLSGVFPLKSLFSLYVKFDVVLSNAQNKFSFPFSTTLGTNTIDLAIFFEKLSKTQNEETLYRFRVENFSSGNFVQIDLNAEEAYSIRAFFKFALY